jgi:hypothetical protein
MPSRGLQAEETSVKVDGDQNDGHLVHLPENAFLLEYLSPGAQEIKGLKLPSGKIEVTFFPQQCS